MKIRAFHPVSLAFVISLLMMVAALLAPLTAQANDKYAALVIDANSGAVLHSEDASEIRHPASLTKLMTLYLTFDALRTGRLHMNTTLRASKKAAGMPSTNLRMKPGDRISVRDAIRALVVRSANDVAVILAEELAGSEYQFGKRMTATARRLGMKNTTFRNASGLPDRKQITTARDMAVLAMALRRHYPQYYHFFSAQKFRYKGRTYTGHNRAMRRITGADGLKTGYIRMSGFNLITSATRGDKSLIGVVMGGRSSKSRDDRMVTLVERTFSHMHGQSGRRQFVLNQDPKPKDKPRELLALAQMLPGKRALEPKENMIQLASVEHAVDAGARPQFISANFGSGRKTLQFTPPTPRAQPQPQQAISAQPRSQFTPVSYQQPSSASHRGGQRVWGVQVGAYEDPREALVAASDAVSRIPKILHDARVDISDQQKVRGKTLHRARLADMTENQAKKACQTLETLSTPCFVYREKQGNS